MKRLFTKKRLLSLALALLFIMVLFGAGFLLLPRPTTMWTLQAHGYIDSVSSPIVSRGLVYTLFQKAGFNYTVYAFNAHSGQVKWSSNIAGFIDTTPIVASGLLFVLSDDPIGTQSTLHALDAASGREQWSYQQTSLSSPTVANGSVYLHSSDGNLFALDALSGRQLWSAPVGDGIFSTPIVANNLVYIAAENSGKPGSTVFALDATSGHTFWSAVETTRFVNQLTVADGLVYLAAVSADAQVSALDALSGRTIWSVQLARPSDDANFRLVAASLQATTGIAYITYQGMDPNGPIVGPMTLYALDTTTGQRVWTAPTASPMPTIANGKVYIYSGIVFSGNGALSVLDARSGRQLWSHPAVPFIDQSVSIAPEPAVTSGTVYVWTMKNNKDTLYALNAVSGSEQWSYQTGGSFSTSPTVVQGIVYTCLSDGFDENVQVIQPPGGAPGFSW